MATDLHVMPAGNEPPARPMYRLTLNVTGEGFDIDVTVDGITQLTPTLQRAVLAVLDEAVTSTTTEIGDDHDGQH